MVCNINVPNLELGEIRGWRRTRVGRIPPRSLGDARLEPRPGHEGSYRVAMSWGDAVPLPPDTDGGAVMAGEVSVTWLGRLEGVEFDAPGVAATESALDELLS
ncbi:MAG: hypothetical protein D6683_04625 [Actinomyces sp.]|nr:MAG: hypothetical protein D6683_04625 [Actinomyces sp.]